MCDSRVEIGEEEGIIVNIIIDDRDTRRDDGGTASGS